MAMTFEQPDLLFLMAAFCVMRMSCHILFVITDVNTKKYIKICMIAAVDSSIELHVALKLYV